VRTTSQPPMKKTSATLSARRLFALVALMLTLVGCAPTVQLKTAVLQGGSFEGARFDAILAFENPNTFDVQVRTVRANVRVDGIAQPIPVTFAPNVWIPAGRTVNIAVPVTVPWTVVPPLAVMTLSGTDVDYRIVGRADVTATRAYEIDQNNYAFNEEGTVPKNVFIRVGAPFTIGLGAAR
jgi:hypothetical protein